VSLANSKISLYSAIATWKRKTISLYSLKSDNYSSTERYRREFGQSQIMRFFPPHFLCNFYQYFSPAISWADSISRYCRISHQFNNSRLMNFQRKDYFVFALTGCRSETNARSLSSILASIRVRSTTWILRGSGKERRQVPVIGIKIFRCQFIPVHSGEKTVKIFDRTVMATCVFCNVLRVWNLIFWKKCYYHS